MEPYQKQLYKTWIENIVAQNKDKDFVQRIIDPSKKLNNKDGSESTHSMAYGEADGKYYVYPTVVNKSGSLIRLDDDAAWEHAKKTGELIPFDHEEDAKLFSKEYKRMWR